MPKSPQARSNENSGEGSLSQSPFLLQSLKELEPLDLDESDPESMKDIQSISGDSSSNQLDLAAGNTDPQVFSQEKNQRMQEIYQYFDAGSQNESFLLSCFSVNFDIIREQDLINPLDSDPMSHVDMSFVSSQNDGPSPEGQTITKDEVVDPTVEPTGPEQKHKGASGKLRRLSAYAFQIVHREQQITQNKLSSLLAEKMSSEFTPKDSLKAKSNVKRRAYDALNVLKSVGALGQQGETIFINKKQRDIRARSLSKKTQMKEQADYLEEKRRTIQLKRQKLDRAQVKNKAVQDIVTRNKKQETRPENCIPFPFVALFLPKLPEVALSKEENKLQATLKEPFSAFGDVDFLLFKG